MPRSKLLPLAERKEIWFGTTHKSLKTQACHELETAGILSIVKAVLHHNGLRGCHTKKEVLA